MHTLQSSSDLDTTVLICGGGPTGLTLGIVLRRHGISCRIIDRDSQYHEHSRGKGIQPRTLEVFDDLGIVDEIRAHGTSSGGVRFYTNKEPVATVNTARMSRCLRMTGGRRTRSIAPTGQRWSWSDPTATLGSAVNLRQQRCCLPT